MNEGRIPNLHVRVVRVHVSTGYSRVEGNRRTSRNGRVSDLPPEIPHVTIRNSFIAVRHPTAQYADGCTDPLQQVVGSPTRMHLSALQFHAAFQVAFRVLSRDLVWIKRIKHEAAAPRICCMRSPSLCTLTELPPSPPPFLAASTTVEQRTGGVRAAALTCAPWGNMHIPLTRY